MGEEDEIITGFAEAVGIKLDDFQEDILSKLWNNTNYGRRGTGFHSDKNDSVRVFRPGERGYDPPDVYFDAGIVLKEGIAITHDFFISCTREEWAQLEEWVNLYSNLRVQEMVPEKLLYIDNILPCVTSLGRDGV